MKDIYKVFGSDNPAEAGLRWYDSQWWNPVRGRVDDFTTLGGQFERRDARVHRICGLESGLRQFFGF